MYLGSVLHDMGVIFMPLTIQLSPSNLAYITYFFGRSPRRVLRQQQKNLTRLFNSADFGLGFGWGIFQKAGFGMLLCT